MFLKPIVKTIKATGERKIHYRLCESYRFENTVRHQTILHLGSLEDLPEIDQKKALGIRIDELVRQSRTGNQSLFELHDQLIETLAQKYFAAIKAKRRLDVAAGKDYHRIDTNTVKNKNIKEVGSEWLCMQALQQLDISTFLDLKCWPPEQIHLACRLIRLLDFRSPAASVGRVAVDNIYFQRMIFPSVPIDFEEMQASLEPT